MDLLEIMQSHGFVPKKVSSTNGGEYHSPCPACGGKDRFSIHLGKNRYFCRKCLRTGDAIQFFREFDGLSFVDAATRVGRILISTPFESKKQLPILDVWQNTASTFTASRHRMLLQNKQGLSLLAERSISLESIQQFQLGWQEYDQWDDPIKWGFSTDAKKVYLPAGTVIPFIQKERSIKLKIRRSSWKPEDTLPKYLEIRGSSQKTVFLGENKALPTMVLESELDAILMTQGAGDLCNFAALGGATKRPDPYTSGILSRSKCLLYTLDFDEAGIAAYKWWKSTFPNLVIWMPPIGKSPGDAFLQGVDLRIWVQLGIESSYSVRKL